MEVPQMARPRGYLPEGKTGANFWTVNRAMSAHPDSGFVAVIAIRDALFANLLAVSLEAAEIAEGCIILDSATALERGVDVNPERPAVLITESSILNGPEAGEFDRWISERSGITSAVVICPQQRLLSQPAMVDRFGNHWALINRSTASFDQLVLALQAARAGLVMSEPDSGRSEASHFQSLTEIEQLALQAIASGKTNAAAARALHVSEKTIERVLRSCYRKLGLAETSPPECNPRVLAALRYHGVHERE